MNSVANLSDQLSIDTTGLTALKRQAKDDPRVALKSASQQFEAVFMQMVLKSMRDASPKDGLFDSEQTRLYQSMLDQQLAQNLSSKGATGLSALIEKQLSRGLTPASALAPDSTTKLQPNTAAANTNASGLNEGEGAALPSHLKMALEKTLNKPLSIPRDLQNSATAASAPTALSAEGVDQVNKVAALSVPAPAREFVNRLWPNAAEASRTTGIPAHFMIAQAALETGWGKSELRHADGKPTYNLFGIKAGRSWNGAVAESTTTEFVNGVAQKSVEKFRAYGSYAEAFRDYAAMLASNPRYAAVLNQQDPSAFAKGLQQAGYATDPMYADKLTRIIGGATLRAGLVG